MIAITYPAMHAPPLRSPESRRLDHHHDADRYREEHRDRCRDDHRALARWWVTAAHRPLTLVLAPRRERQPADPNVRQRADGQPEAAPEQSRPKSLSPDEPQRVLIDERDHAADDRQGHEPRPYRLAVRTQPVRC